jgi:N-acetylneuraminic acid mutarotase
VRPTAITLLVVILGLPTTVAGQSPAPSIPPPAPTATATLTDPAWSRLEVGRGPAAREDATWTVDPTGNSAYLFGGRDGQTTFEDLWRFDLATDGWSRLRPSGDRPGARFGHAAAWVDGIGLLVFGGQRGTAFLDDLWVYDPASDHWRALPRRGQAPAARYGTCAIVDAEGRFVISHGFTFNGRFDDTRAYDVERERWLAIAPDGRRPGERCLHDCFLDAAGQLVLYGGQDDGSRALGDLWRFGGERWTRLDDPSPAARRLHASTVAGSDAWIFGGAGRDDTVLGDLWRVDRGSLAFARVRPEGMAPPPRSAAVMIADPLRSRILLFGGRDRRAFDDLWELRSSPPEPTTSAVPVASSSA